MKQHFAILALATTFALPAPAQAAAIIDFDATSEISDSNDFKAWLSGLGLTRYATLGSSITLDADTQIRFELLGTESGFNDTFFTVSAPDLLYTETTAFADSFLAPILIGTASFGAGSLAGLLNFASSGGASATVGEDGFGIFLAENQLAGGAFDTFYFGYDDQVTGQDDDHDDFIVRATLLPLTTAVPEPGTWALLLAGFGLAGAALRRRRPPARLRAARI
jgi:hypothetical protein